MHAPKQAWSSCQEGTGAVADAHCKAHLAFHQEHTTAMAVACSKVWPSVRSARGNSHTIGTSFVHSPEPAFQPGLCVVLISEPLAANT